MPSIETSIWLALRGRVETLVLAPAQRIAWPDESFTPTGALENYLEVLHFPNTSERLFINRGNAARYQGILQISSMYQLNLVHGETQAREIAGQIAAHFPADILLPYGVIRVRVTKSPDVLRGVKDEAAARWRTPVSIRYELLNI